MTSRCSIKGCGQPVVARGLCQKHWQRWKKHGDPRTSLIDREHSRRCSADGCTRDYYARGLCKQHYEQAKYHGGVRARQRETVCSVDGCGRPVYARGLCQRCYQRDRYRAKHSLPPIHAAPTSEQPQTRPATKQVCWAADCERFAVRDSGLCDEHHAIAEEWNEIAAFGVCYYQGCGREPMFSTVDWEFPLCEYHEQTVFWTMALERDFGLLDAPTYTDNDWLSARFLAEVYRDAHGNSRRSAYRKVSGSPVFQPLFATMLTLVPWVQKNVKG